jgi:1-acyl-sn-glycerol-3-phosphate acyltransferase
MTFRDREPFTNLLLYSLFKWSMVSPIFNIYFCGRIRGAEKVPLKGPLVIVSNHASYFDPPLLSCAVRRPVAYMAKEELFRLPLLGQGIRVYGAYPVNRSTSDLSAIKSALAALQNGWAAGIFLEGTRTADGLIHTPKLGATMVAAKAKVPILPVCLWGTEKIFSQSSFPQPVPITIRIGDLIPAPTSTKRAELEKITQQCTSVINGLHDLGR